MTIASTPWILSDNFLDDVILHTDHVVSQSGTEVSGTELYCIADNLRDMTHFSPAETNTDISITVNCGSAKAFDTVVIDRGHNFAGKTVELRGSTDNFGGSNVLLASCVVPSNVGGLPGDANGVTTNEGVWWKTIGSVSYQYYRAVFKAMGVGITPVVTGLYFGAGYRFPAYLDTPGAYDYRLKQVVLKNNLSERGVRIKRRVINFAEVDLKIQLEEPDFLTINPHFQRLFLYNHPWWFCLDDSVFTGGSDLMRLFQLPGDATYDPSVTATWREIRALLEEVIPRMTV